MISSEERKNVCQILPTRVSKVTAIQRRASEVLQFLHPLSPEQFQLRAKQSDAPDFPPCLLSRHRPSLSFHRKIYTTILRAVRFAVETL